MGSPDPGEFGIGQLAQAWLRPASRGHPGRAGRCVPLPTRDALTDGRALSAGLLDAEVAGLGEGLGASALAVAAAVTSPGSCDGALHCATRVASPPQPPNPRATTANSPVNS
ncbi:MAG TPA: hypothetical protein VK453_21805 [Micromonosporaceae bacterium]|nr:hypothetical protein [Micromonosporaceae bacterium]